MEKRCGECQEYWRVRREELYDHPCMLSEKSCSAHKLEWNRDVCLKKYPRLVAHLICESLGYFSPFSAANAISFYKHNQAFFCEWYSHMAQFEPEKQMFNECAVKRVGRKTLLYAFLNRKRHQGYMADYKQAIGLVKRELDGKGEGSSMLASWF
jgi:hypothetical protein